METKHTNGTQDEATRSLPSDRSAGMLESGSDGRRRRRRRLAARVALVSALAPVLIGGLSSRAGAANQVLPPPPPPPGGLPTLPTAPSEPVNRQPVGEIVLSLTEGRNYGLLAWSVDPDTGRAARMRVTVEGVSSREVDANYSWADMPARTGQKTDRALLYLAQLPSGTRSVCVDARDDRSGRWTRIGCRSHTVK